MTELLISSIEPVNSSKYIQVKCQHNYSYTITRIMCWPNEPIIRHDGRPANNNDNNSDNNSCKRQQCEDAAINTNHRRRSNNANCCHKMNKYYDEFDTTIDNSTIAAPNRFSTNTTKTITIRPIMSTSHHHHHISMFFIALLIMLISSSSSSFASTLPPTSKDRLTRGKSETLLTKD